MHPALVVDEESLGHIRMQPDETPAGKEMRGERTGQNDHKRQMEQHDSHTLVEPLLHHVGTGHHRKHRPQRREPPRAIDMLTHKRRAMVFLNDRGKPYTHHDEYV